MNTKRIDALAVMQRQIDLALSYGNGDRAEALSDVADAVGNLLRAADTITQSLLPHITEGNAMSPQAIMVRNLADAVRRAKGEA